MAPRRTSPFVPRAPGEPLRIVFLSRISLIKNLDFALNVLKQVRIPAVFDIYGQADDQAYWTYCQSLIADMPSHISVRYHGSIDHHDVPATLTRYDLFFLPTRGENYGHAIVESFAAGTPVLISDATPWRNLVEREVGWDLPLGNREAFAGCIDRLSEFSAEEYALYRAKSLAFFKTQVGNRRAVEENKSLLVGTNN
jgi:glycosyltransferase involved in cell wall biosynthesis